MMSSRPKGDVRSRPSGLLGEMSAIDVGAELAVGAGVVHVPRELLGDDADDERGGVARLRRRPREPDRQRDARGAERPRRPRRRLRCRKRGGPSRPRGWRAAAGARENAPAPTRNTRPSRRTAPASAAWTSHRTLSIAAACALMTGPALFSTEARDPHAEAGKDAGGHADEDEHSGADTLAHRAVFHPETDGDRRRVSRR